MSRPGRRGEGLRSGKQIEWTRALIRRRQRARMRQQRQPVPRGAAQELARIRAVLESGSTDRERIEAAAALARPLVERQGHLL